MRAKRRFATAVLVLGGLLALPASAGAAIIAPNITTDEFTDPLAGAGCSLREAIQAANTDGVFGGCNAANEAADTIVLTPGATYVRTITGGEDANAMGDYDITNEDLTIMTTGAPAAIQGDTTMNGDRVFHTGISGGLTMQISNVIIRNGNAFGGGIGGGILHASGTLNLINSAVVTNNAMGFGGGMANSVGATLNLRNVTISGNTADADGGGFDQTGGTVSFNNVTVTQNTADNDMMGGGNSGGINIFDGSFTLSNTIIAGNTDASGGTAPDCGGGGPTTINESLGFNLIGTLTGCPWFTATTGDTTGAAGLGPLAADGTHPLLAGSQAINTGEPNLPGTGIPRCEATDQRGVARPQDGRCDKGAYELIPTPTSPPGGGTGTTAVVPQQTTTGQRAAALKKCKKKRSKRARRNCRKRAQKLPL